MNTELSGPKPLTMNQFIQNVLSRLDFMRSFFDSSTRDIDKECGHPESISIDQHRRAFQRGDVAGRIISIYPEESWASDPDIYETEDPSETEFEKAWKALDNQFQLMSYMLRADVLSGIGRFGIILLGIDDGKALNLPVDGVIPDGITIDATAEGEAPTRKLLYLQTFEEGIVAVKEVEKNVNNPRYGLPTMYTVTFIDVNSIGGVASAGTVSQKGQQTDIHWTRVIHVCDNRTNSEVYGTPRLERVYNRWLDVRKIAGGSGEMFWKGGFPGLSLETLPAPDGQTVELDVTATKEQVQAYMEGLQRYLVTQNLQVKNLGTQVADPGPSLEAQLKLISCAIGCPWRIFMGSEVGQLASGQDIVAWNKRITRRRKRYITPYIILPMIRRLQQMKILPAVTEPDGVKVYWEDLNAPSKDDQAKYAQTLSDAIQKYLMVGGDQLIDPFHFLTLVLGMEDDEADAILEAVGTSLVDTVAAEEAAAQAKADQAELMAKAAGRNPNGNVPNPQFNGQKA